jgi:DeoR/GlpR family transcriptional regulator of sugar metabolism
VRKMRHRLRKSRRHVDISRRLMQDVRMRDDDRRTLILDNLRATGRASVPDLAAALGVTPSTIRRDLDRLARDGRVVRTYGGASLADRIPPATEADPAGAAKAAIAAAAATLVPDGATIAIGSGSTALAFARELAARRTTLTVITNALDVANALLDHEGIELIVLGGVVRPRMHSMLGHLAELATGELRADMLVIGIGAINPDQGLMNDSVPEILTDRALRRMARTCVVLADATKFTRVEPGFVFGLDEVDVLVTDSAVPDAIATAVREHGVEVVIATAPVSGPVAMEVR